jgi:P-type conjugative transfer ATPase TrbB
LAQVTTSVREEQHQCYQARLLQDIPDFIQNYMSDPAIIEIMANPDGSVWVDDLHSGQRSVGTIEAAQVESLLNVIASLSNTAITKEQPILECELPYDGSRFAGMIPPVVERPIFSIRRKAIQIFSLKDYVAAGILSETQKTVIDTWIKARKNILIVGGTSSGKTTLINAVIQAITEHSPEHRLILLEDTVELQSAASNIVAMRSSREVSLQALVKATLRHRPDRIIVGEVRGKEAFDLLTAWSTGHPGGVASLHANSAEGAFLRLEQLLELATQSPMKTLIGEAVDAIVYIEKTGNGRKVKTLLTVDGYRNQQYQIQTME